MNFKTDINEYKALSGLTSRRPTREGTLVADRSLLALIGEDVGPLAEAEQKLRFPEGTMTEKEWVSKYAHSVEAVTIKWQSLINKKKWNGLEGQAQTDYENKLKKQAEKPQYRAWRTAAKDVFQVITKSTYDWAKTQGIKAESVAEATAKPAKLPKIPWKSPDKDIYTAVVEYTWGADAHNSPKAVKVALRIDGRKKGVFRVDMKSMPMEPWEAVDGGEQAAPKTLAAAKALADKWLAASSQQRTYTPHGVAESAVREGVRTEQTSPLQENDALQKWLAAPGNMKKAADLLYQNTHKDFRGSGKGKDRSVMAMSPKGTTLFYLDGKNMDVATMAMLVGRNAKAMKAVQAMMGESEESAPTLAAFEAALGAVDVSDIPTDRLEHYFPEIAYLTEASSAERDAASMKKYGVIWRTTKTGHVIGLNKNGKITKGNPTLLGRIKHAIRQATKQAKRVASAASAAMRAYKASMKGA